jgi:hypothetical protein
MPRAIRASGLLALVLLMEPARAEGPDAAASPSAELINAIEQNTAAIQANTAAIEAATVAITEHTQKLDEQKPVIDSIEQSTAGIAQSISALQHGIYISTSDESGLVKCPDISVGRDFAVRRCQAQLDEFCKSINYASAKSVVALRPSLTVKDLVCSR